jgi:hypothetical protein
MAYRLSEKRDLKKRVEGLLSEDTFIYNVDESVCLPLLTAFQLWLTSCTIIRRVVRWLLSPTGTQQS